MRNPLFVSRATWSIVLTTAAFTYDSQARAASPDDPLTTPSQLVEQALESELQGADHQRAVLLKRAIELDPNYAPARWQSGFVQVDGKWLSLEEAARRAANDPNRIAYHKRRDALVDTADNQREMARWCKKHKLNDEERLHWTKVLEFNPQDAEALSQLGLQWYDGQMLTRTQIEARKQRVTERARAMQQWRPELVKLRSAIERDKQSAAAIARLAQINDPAAIPALEAVFVVPAAHKHNARLGCLMVDTVARMLQPEATGVLVRRAVFAASDDVAMAAADALKQRPQHSYVPALIAAAPGQLKSRFQVSVLPGGQVVHEHLVELADGRATVSLNYESLVLPTDAAAAAVVTPIALMSEQVRAAAIEANVAAELRVRDALRARIGRVLARTADFDEGAGAEKWLRQYAELCSWGLPEGQPREFRRSAIDYAVFYSQPDYRSSPAPEPNPRMRRATPWEVSRMMTGALRFECFPAGTPVLTLDGLRPIESIKPGDRVLSQDVATGELGYKSVQNRTLRRSATLVKLTLGDTTITSTPGHPFFVLGEGWRVAKQLKVGARLRGLKEDAVVTNVEMQPALDVYNLVVCDFSTFFVGDQALLVHDDTQVNDSRLTAPGLTTVGTTALSAATK